MLKVDRNRIKEECEEEDNPNDWPTRKLPLISYSLIVIKRLLQLTRKARWPGRLLDASRRRSNNIALHTVMPVSPRIADDR